MIYGYLYLLIEALAFYSAFRAIMETRTAQGAVGWAVFLISFPLLGLPAYWIFGRSHFIGYKSARQIKDERVREALFTLRERLRPYTYQHSDKYGIDVIKTDITTLPALRGNDVALLINGEATFASILEGIEHASKYVLLEFYIIEEGDLASRIAELLCKKAREGVRIYVLYDELGSYSLSSEYTERLERCGVHTSPFNTIKKRYRRFQLNFRNHRKLVVVDGKECWIGGHNIGDEYIDRDKRFPHWRDTHVRIGGPAAIAAQLSFAEDWNWAQDELIVDLLWDATPSKKGDVPVLILPTGPADRLATAELAFIHFINSAKERIWIATPYFVPDDATLTALQLAALHGVDVRILIPEKPNHLLVYFAAFAYFGEVDEVGVQFYRYQKGFMHQKAVLVDDYVGSIGSANFDNRSFRLNFEITSLIYDKTFCDEVEAMFERDFAASRREQAKTAPLSSRLQSRTSCCSSTLNRFELSKIVSDRISRFDPGKYPSFEVGDIAKAKLFQMQCRERSSCALETVSNDLYILTELLGDLVDRHKFQFSSWDCEDGFGADVS